MKAFLLVGAALALPFFGSENKPAKASPPIDTDLYRQNAECYSLHGSFLFWRVQEASLDYALAMTQNGWGPAQCFAQGKYQNATFNGDPGFRVALSYFRAPKYWEFWAEYTRLTASGTNVSEKPAPAGNFLTGTWPQIFTTPVASASSYIHMNYNVADLLVTRVFFPNPHLRLRLAGGGTAAWIDQFWKVVYRDSGNSETKIGNRWRFYGGGLRMGTLFDWYWFGDIYMTGGTTFAALLGFYRNSAEQTTNFTPAPIGGVTFNPALPVRDAKFRDVRPAFSCQFYLGPAYEKSFTNQRFEFFVGYELNAWMNLQEIFRSTSGAPSDAKETWIDTGMIALQGLTARATLDF